jgi:importin subunit alpha-6/7
MTTKRLSMLKNVTWTMSNLCNGVSDRHWDRIESVLPLFAQSLNMKDEEILKDVCWSLSYISSGTKERIQSVLDLNGNVLRRLVHLLTHRSPSVQHAALITVGNIVTGLFKHTHAHTCTHMHTHAHTCTHEHTYAHICTSHFNLKQQL